MSAAAQKLTPYKEVVERYFELYSSKGVDDGWYIEFEKRSEGWYVNVIKTDYSRTSDLFWSAKNQKYQKLPYLPVSDLDDNEAAKKKALDSRSLYYYNSLPYYGYIGWDADVIALYETQPALNDTMLAALAKAYSTYSFSLLNLNMSWSDTSRLAIPLNDFISELSDKKLKVYRKYSHLAIATYERLQKQNPSFATFVGNINTQVGNEHLTSYLNLLMYANEEEAVKELKPSLYSDFIINLSKNYLGTVEKDGILITNGDNDTYPLLYVQAQYGFRRDVRVVNSSLLASTRYIRLMRASFLDSAPIDFSIADTSYASDKTILVKLSSSEEEVRLTEVLENLNNSNGSEFKDGNYYSIPHSRYYLSAQNGDKLNFAFNQEYVYRNDIALLDLIVTTALKRSLYFAISVAPNVMSFAEPYCKQEGMAIKMHTYKTGEELDTDKCYNNITSVYQWAGTSMINSKEVYMAYNYLNLFGKTIENLVNVGRKDSALVLLNLQKKLFPDNIVQAGVYNLKIMDGWFGINQPEEGNLLANTILTNLVSKAKLNMPDFNSDIYIRIIAFIKNTANRHGQTALASRCESLLKEKGY